MKKIGYCYRCNPADLEAAGCELVYVDTPKTDRLERRDMLKMGLRKDDTLVLLKPGDLGAVGELKRLREQIEAMGVTIEIYEPAKPLRRPGAPRKYDPEPELRERIGVMWHDLDLSGPYVLRRAQELVGEWVRRHHLNEAYGPRSKRK